MERPTLRVTVPTPVPMPVSTFAATPVPGLLRTPLPKHQLVLRASASKPVRYISVLNSHEGVHAALLQSSPSKPCRDNAEAFKRRDDLRVLFVGNSATYFNDLPEMAARLVPGLCYEQVTRGGQSLVEHAKDRCVQWMITGEDDEPEGGIPRISTRKHQQGWNFLLLQDRADVLRDISLANLSRHAAGLQESQCDSPDDGALHATLCALDTLAGHVRTAAARMAQRPTVVLFHRFLWDPHEFHGSSQTKLMRQSATEGIQLYRRRLATGLGDCANVVVLPAFDAHALVHDEDPETFAQLFAGDKSHPSRLGTYLVALLLFVVVTGQSPKILGAAAYRPVADDASRLHAEMHLEPSKWCSSDAWQRHVWPDTPLPVVDGLLALRFQDWAHRAAEMAGLLGDGRAVRRDPMVQCIGSTTGTVVSPS